VAAQMAMTRRPSLFITGSHFIALRGLAFSCYWVKKWPPEDSREGFLEERLAVFQQGLF
jgi:hypothetical protein